MKSFKDYHLMEEQKGTFVGVKFSNRTKDAIVAFIEKYGIPNPISKDELHTTLIFSRTKIENFAADSLVYPIVGHAVSPTIWETGDKSGFVLVMKIAADRLAERHKEIMQSHPEATYDFPTYVPHVTLSYDIDRDFDINTINTLMFPPVEIVEEYEQELDLNFGKKDEDI